MSLKSAGKNAGKNLLISIGTLAAAFVSSTITAAWMLVRPQKRQTLDCVPRIRYGKFEPLTLFTSDDDNIRHALSNRLAVRLGSSLTPLIAWPIEFVVEQLVQLRAEDLDPAGPVRCRELRAALRRRSQS